MNPIKVQSIDSLKVLRAAMCKFAETVRLVLGEADSELQRALNWIETEADSHWQGQIRSRQAAIVKAKDALRGKQIYAPTGAKPSTVDEEKALRLAVLRLQEAEGKLSAVHRYGGVLQKEAMQYKGQAQRLANMATIDLPIAIGKLDALLRDLEAYVGVKVTEAEEGAGEAGAMPSGSGVVTEGAGSMVRAVEPEGEGNEGERGRGGEGENEGAKERKSPGATSDGVPEGNPIRNPQSEIRNSEGGTDLGRV